MAKDESCPSEASIKPFHAADYFYISVYAFALSVLWNGLGPIILPVRVLDFIPEALKNTYLGILTFFGLLLAIIIQPVMGALSDRLGLGGGQRRPFILVGTLLALVFLAAIGLSGSYAILFLSYLALQFASNTAQGPYQAFIPDLVPEGRRGLASGAKNLAEILGIIICSWVVGFFMDRYLGTQDALWLWLALGLIALVLLAAMLLTLLAVREKPLEGPRRGIWATARGTFTFDVKGNPDFLWFLVSRFLIIISMTSIQSFTFYFIQDVILVPNPAQVTGELMAIIGLWLLLTTYLAGYLSDRMGRKPLLFFSGLLGSLGIFLLLFAQTREDVLLYGSLIGISMGVFLSSNWALATDLVPKEEAGRYLGLSNLATAGGGAVARLNGPLIDVFNARQPGQGYSALFLICVIYFLLGTALLGKVQEKRKVRRPF